MRSDRRKIGNTISLAVIGVLLTAFAVFLTSCAGVVFGSGNVKEETRDVHDFNSVSLSGMGDLIIKQGNKESLRIEAEDNILPEITTMVNNGQLTIDYKSSGFPIRIVPKRPITFFLTVKNLSEIDLSGSANIKDSKLNANTLLISTSGSSDVTINVKAKELICRSSGSSRFNMSGAVDRQQVDISGSATYTAADLASKTCFIDISGSGNGSVNVSNLLDVRISGSGDVSYIGNPTVRQSISGSGTVRKVSR